MDWSHVKSKVAEQSQANIDYEPDGGDVTITSLKLDWQAESKVDDNGIDLNRRRVIFF